MIDRKPEINLEYHSAKIFLILQATQELRLNLIHNTLEADGLSK